MAKPNLDNYITVAERIDLFYAKYKDGSLRCKEIRPFEIGGQNFILYIAQAFRTPDDPAPAEGVAWEPVPGKSNFTRDSEVMNCETSAWGRAIAALGFEVKRGIASREEVRRAQEGQATASKAGDPNSGRGHNGTPASEAVEAPARPDSKANANPPGASSTPSGSGPAGASLSRIQVIDLERAEQDVPPDKWSMALTHVGAESLETVTDEQAERLERWLENRKAAA